MPCIIIGQIKIETISGGVINFGDTHTISLKNISKSVSGSGENGGVSSQSESNEISGIEGNETQETRNSAQ
ncbi:spore germination protein [Metabacillus sp. Hm71]|uniref:spore germination protein n=1 Tax=Metabacillus sp. Hm71 TaxID=3450743 RepID=UPI003F427B5D